MDIDDAVDRKPLGETTADPSTLKTRNDTLRIGTWNVRTLYEAGKLDNLMVEFEELKLDILGIAETHWKGSGLIKRDNHTIIYSGGEQNRRGVGFLFNSKIAKCLAGYWPINERLIMCKIQAKPFNLVILQCYAPTADQSDEIIEEFYTEIDLALKQTKSTDIVYVMGDFNAKIGKSVASKCVGKFGLGKTNERGEMLIEFCEKNNLCAINTMYKHPKRRLYTWKSPGDVTRNQIDFILLKDRFKNNILKCKTYPGADINSDHNPVIATVKMKLKIPHKTKSTPRYDLSALKMPEVRREFAIKVENKFGSLMEINDPPENASDQMKIDNKWGCLRDAIIETQEEIIPKSKREAKRPWMTSEILELMRKRKSKKGTEEYHTINKTIKQECREAKEKWANEKCKKIEQLSRDNNNKAMFKEIKKNDKRKKRFRWLHQK